MAFLPEGKIREQAKRRPGQDWLEDLIGEGLGERDRNGCISG